MDLKDLFIVVSNAFIVELHIHYLITLFIYFIILQVLLYMPYFL